MAASSVDEEFFERMVSTVHVRQRLCDLQEEFGLTDRQMLQVVFGWVEAVLGREVGSPAQPEPAPDTSWLQTPEAHRPSGG